MTKKIIAVDLDGTLLNSESKLSDFTKETIKKISEKRTPCYHHDRSSVSYGKRLLPRTRIAYSHD